MVLQFIPLETHITFLIGKLNGILEIKVDFNFLVKFLINKILITRREEAGIIKDEEFGSHKYYCKIKVALFRRLLWDRIRQMRTPGDLGYMGTSRPYESFPHSASSLAAQFW